MSASVLYRGQSQMQQKMYNEAKNGFYPTELNHCIEISNLFSFSKEEETCVLEPSIGDGTAVKAVTDVRNNDKVRIFGVELNDERAGICAADPEFECILCADFLNGVYISNNVFSFCFGNPPYGDETGLGMQVKKERLEKKFLEKTWKYLTRGGILAWVIPHRILIEDSYASTWMSYFETLGVYKFHPSEYAKFGQVLVIGKKRGTRQGVMVSDRQAFQSRIELDKLSELPLNVKDEDKIIVPPSSTSAVANFRTIAFDPDAADSYVRKNPGVLSSLNSAIAAKTGVRSYKSAMEYRPPKPVSRQNLALLTACGIGSGYAGSEENGDVHLQRGSVTSYVEREFKMVNGSEVLVERTRSSTNIIIIENDGTITDLVKQNNCEE